MAVISETCGEFALQASYVQMEKSFLYDASIVDLPDGMIDWVRFTHLSLRLCPSLTMTRVS